MKILVCLDETRAAKEALATSIAHAKAFGGKVVLITSLLGGSKDDIKEDQQAEKRLRQAESRLKSEGVPCETHLMVRGLSSGEDIVEFSKELGIDEIIIGVKRKSKLGKLVFGSTAQHVILEAECPVVTVK